jgi:peptidoglycan/xylan/chitin deacetylase (PgdA/CDA1 family)
LRSARHLAALSAAAALAAGCGAAATSHAPTPPGSTPPPRAAPAPLDAAIAPVTGREGPAGPRDAPVAILMYHVIGRAPARAAYPELWVPTGRFRAQMRALARAGYHGVTLARVHDAWHGRASLPVRPVVISFDDGYLSQARAARAVLDRRGWPGVLNLEVHNVGLPGGLSRGQVTALARDGWEIDAHTLTHPDLTTLDPAALRREVAGSRAWLRRVFGLPVRFFAYPAGRYDPAVEAAVRHAGFEGATTTAPGIGRPHQDQYALPRIRVLPETTARQLVALVRAPRRT